ncbi:CLUMA_CG015678, isoform A [Clunio marinus]|uniref:CLUMA_CG015678, isoform A n=1 Tax=Clunio marinus TaxID=568069 RepID=A0A1J1IS40_9DIPT|nr:CLUMA_CG015678, isoform A [Clunio marinus]
MFFSRKTMTTCRNVYQRKRIHREHGDDYIKEMENLMMDHLESSSKTYITVISISTSHVFNTTECQSIFQ